MVDLFWLWRSEHDGKCSFLILCCIYTDRRTFTSRFRTVEQIWKEPLFRQKNAACAHNARSEVIIQLQNDLGRSEISEWPVPRRLRLREHTGKPQAAETGAAFADLLSAMEALPEALVAGKSRDFITELILLHLWVNFPSQSCVVVRVTRTLRERSGACLKRCRKQWFLHVG